MNECNCSLTEKLLGDGCRICNPQEMIDLLLEHITELEQCIAESEQRVKELEGANSIILKKLNEVPKNCTTCKHYEIGIYCGLCSYSLHDYYEPKE